MWLIDDYNRKIVSGTYRKPSTGLFEFIHATLEGHLDSQDSQFQSSSSAAIDENSNEGSVSDSSPDRGSPNYKAETPWIMWDSTTANRVTKDGTLWVRVGRSTNSAQCSYIVNVCMYLVDVPVCIFQCVCGTIFSFFFWGVALTEPLSGLFQIKPQDILFLKQWLCHAFCTELLSSSA